MALPAMQVRESRLLSHMIPAYTKSLYRLTGDFSAAAAFLLSGPLFERIGCTGRSFVATAKAAYAGRPSADSSAEARRLGLELLAEAGTILDQLNSVAGEYGQELAERRRTGAVLAKSAEGFSRNAERALRSGLQAVLGDPDGPLADDPEDLAARLGRVASEAFNGLRKAWEAVYADLENAALPPAPFALSQRQMYIETVKLFNQYRLAAGAGDRSRLPRGPSPRARQRDDGVGDRRQRELPPNVMTDPTDREAAIEVAQRMFQGGIPSRLVETRPEPAATESRQKRPAGRPPDLRPNGLPDPMEREAAIEIAQRMFQFQGIPSSLVQPRPEPARARVRQKQSALASDALTKIVDGVGDVIRAALNQWQRSALERARRQGPQSSRADIDEATLQEELAQITRTIEQWSSLRVELARGLSPRFYLINLLRRASSCSPSR
jgi:hypothetical protein